MVTALSLLPTPIRTEVHGSDPTATISTSIGRLD